MQQLWASTGTFDCRRKYSLDSSISRANNRNHIFLWWQDSMSNVYAAIWIWDLCLNKLDYDRTKVKVIWLDGICFWIVSYWCRNVVICRSVWWRVNYACVFLCRLWHFCFIQYFLEQLTGWYKNVFLLWFVQICICVWRVQLLVKNSYVKVCRLRQFILYNIFWWCWQFGLNRIP